MIALALRGGGLVTACDADMCIVSRVVQVWKPLRYYTVLPCTSLFLLKDSLLVNNATCSAELLDEILQRGVPDDNTAFWACICRAYPDAATDAQQYERALSNLILVFFAGTETTSAAIAATVAALAADADSMQRLEQVCAVQCWLTRPRCCASPYMAGVKDWVHHSADPAVWCEGLAQCPEIMLLRSVASMCQSMP